MNELTGIAAEERAEYPVLGLFVQVENTEAIKLYRRFKFILEGLGSYTDPNNGVTYQKMALILDQAALLQYLDRKKMRRS
jgi:ribosomal protein S18 acetylase RimI-like enzyme